MKIELSPIGLYTVQFRPTHEDCWLTLVYRPTGWNAAFELYHHCVTERDADGKPVYAPHRIEPVYVQS